MRDGTRALLKAVDAAAPLAAVIYEDEPHRAALVEEIRQLRRMGWTEASAPDAAFDDEKPLLLVADDEPGAVRARGGRREALVRRRAPVVIFLRRAGEGLAELRRHDGLRSWLQASTVEPEALDTVDAEDDRCRFLRDAGRRPEEFLADWLAGRLDDTFDNHVLAHRASLVAAAGER